MRRYLVLVVGFGAVALFVRLGIWQLDRLAARRALNAELAVHLDAPPLGLAIAAPLGAAPDSFHFRRASAHGTFDFDREVVVLARSYRGVPGVHLVTPLVLSTGQAVLVERGWAPAPDGKTVELATLGETDSGAVEGVLVNMPMGVAHSSAETTWPVYVRTADPQALGPRYPYPLLGLVLRRTPLPQGAPTALRAVPLPELSDGPHLSYAIQWFAFAVIAVVGSIALYRKRAMEDAVGSPEHLAATRG